MKKLFAFFLAVVMLLSFCACTPDTGDGTNTTAGTNADTGNAATGSLLVGYGKADITPTESVPLSGYGATENRMSTGFKSYLYQIALAVTDADGNTAIVIASDTTSISETVTLDIREQIQEECGVPADNIIISALHQHSAPDMGNGKVASSAAYREDIFVPGAVEAAKAAMENRAPATVQTASVETENMNFVRHYVMEDGSYAGNNFGNLNLKREKHATEVDNEMQLIKFIREGQTTQDGKAAKNIILTNFQGHPIRGTSSSSTDAHSDMPGIYRDALEAELDCQAIYFSGASGNVEFWSRIEEENKTADYKEQGEKLAKLAIGAEDTYTDVELTQIKATKTTVTMDINHEGEDRLKEATEAYDLWASTGDKSLVEKYGFESQYQCSAIKRHATMGKTGSFDIFALSFGDIAFIGAPYEMFCDHGEEIKEGSPFEMTIVATIANGSNSYFPTEFAWDYGCYEQYNSNYVRGSGEHLRDTFLEMLDELHGLY